MQVLFDLRPPHLVQSQEQHVDPIRLLSLLLFLIFVFLSVFNIGYTAMHLRNVKAELASARGEELLVTDNSNRLAATITSMRKLRDQAKAYLAFTRLELPAVEFMAALEGAISPALKITNLEIRPGNVVMRGTALSDQDIIDFGDKLVGMRNIVTMMNAPVTTKGTLGSRITSDYTITGNIKSLLEIAASYPDFSIPNPGSTEEAKLR